MKADRGVLGFIGLLLFWVPIIWIVIIELTFFFIPRILLRFINNKIPSKYDWTEFQD